MNTIDRGLATATAEVNELKELKELKERLERLEGEVAARAASDEERRAAAAIIKTPFAAIMLDNTYFLAENNGARTCNKISRQGLIDALQKIVAEDARCAMVFDMTYALGILLVNATVGCVNGFVRDGLRGMTTAVPIVDTSSGAMAFMARSCTICLDVDATFVTRCQDGTVNVSRRQGRWRQCEAELIHVEEFMGFFCDNADFMCVFEFTDLDVFAPEEEDGGGAAGSTEAASEAAADAAGASVEEGAAGEDESAAGEEEGPAGAAAEEASASGGDIADAAPAATRKRRHD
jgi:DNA-binding FrmR family transcriptional regulator